MYYGLRVETVDESQKRDHSNENSLSISLMLCRLLRDSLQIPFSNLGRLRKSKNSSNSEAREIYMYPFTNTWKIFKIQ